MAQGRTRTLFVIDVIIAIALVVAGMSALAFLVPYSTIEFSTSSAAPTFLGVTYGTWRTVHLYAGLAMIIGGLVHFLMHWSWLMRTAKGMVSGTKRVSSAQAQRVSVRSIPEEAHDVQ